MKNLSNPNFRPVTGSDSDVTVSISISKDNLSKMVGWMLTEGISFAISTYQSSAPLPPPVASMPDVVNSQPKKLEPVLPKSINSNGLTTMEVIYQKYIVGGVNKSIPTIEEIAAEFNMSTSSFKMQFSKVYGKSFYQLYMEKRMEYGATLLRKGYKATEVSKRLGYGEKSSIKFNKMFQKHFGITPKKYQMEHHGILRRKG